ncbi:hypothetical protein VIGAN_UM011500 [Vigna angularis var. angularis]|uniref:Uncharacterized protein n=1 Tax=Vigna angularis var. angularis TaxID=157739 RepID=A0A0S3TD86_PHAAN|nr:hypothetical protein VIGAN_UM011500 [Vigna angularis var. angularis]
MSSKATNGSTQRTYLTKAKLHIHGQLLDGKWEPHTWKSRFLWSSSRTSIVHTAAQVEGPSSLVWIEEEWKNLGTPGKKRNIAK